METRISRGGLFAVALASAAIASVLTLTLTATLRSDRIGARDLPGGDAALAPLLGELRRLSETLGRSIEAGIVPAGGSVEPEPQRQPVADVGAVAVDQRVASLLERIDLLIADLRARPLGGAAWRGGIDPRVRLAGERWDSLDGFLALHRADPTEARRSILFLTTREIVERFGIPTDSGSGKGTMWMAYQQRDERDQIVFNLYLSFADGIVMFYELTPQ